MSKQGLFLVFIVVALASFHRAHQTAKESQAQFLHAKQIPSSVEREAKQGREIAPPEMTASEPEGRIVFTSYRRGRASSVFSMRPDGSELRVLGMGGSPCCSPDGTRILVVRFFNDTGRFEIVLASADGKFLKRVTKSETEDSTSPAWSPDGKRIAFQSGEFNNPSIYVMNADGSDRLRITPDKSNDRGPAWSPDGTRIAFSSYRDGKQGVFVMNADGSGVTRLSDKSWSASDPAWSPDGRYIASVVYVRQGRRYFLRITDFETGDWWDVLKDRERITSPCWSPDGGWLACSMSANNDSDIYLVNARGEGLWNLTHEKAADLDPSWMPDAKDPGLVRAAR